MDLETHVGLTSNDEGEQAAVDLWMNLLLIAALFVIILLTQIGVPDVSQDRFDALKASFESLDAEHLALATAHADAQQELLELGKAYATETNEHVKARLDRDRARAEAVRYEREASAWRGHASELKRRLQAESIDLVIAVDISQTMADELAINMDTLLCIARSLPTVTTLRIGVVAFREDLRAFPLTQIHPASVDGGKSLRSLERFLITLKAEDGLADVDRALRAATAMLSAADDGVRRQCVAILGDTGPFEMRGSKPHRIDPGEPEAAERLIHHVRNWAAGDRRQVVACYSEDSSASTTQDRDARQKHAASRRFFSSLAGRSGGTFTENPGRLLADLLETAMKEGTG